MSNPSEAENQDSDVKNTGDSDVYERAELDDNGQPSVISRLLSEELPDTKAVQRTKKPTGDDLLPPEVSSKLHNKMKQVINDAFPPLA